MPVERSPASGGSVIDVLDHVLDKGIVIDAWAQVSIVGIDLVTVEARVVVASMQTYSNYADALSQMTPRPVTGLRILAAPPSRPRTLKRGKHSP